jgi:hypothetical protein
MTTIRCINTNKYYLRLVCERGLCLSISFFRQIAKISVILISFLNCKNSAIASPEILQGLSDLFAPSSLDVAQDVLKACEHGKLSHNAALQMVEIALADDQERKMKRIN